MSNIYLGHLIYLCSLSAFNAWNAAKLVKLYITWNAILQDVAVLHNTIVYKLVRRINFKSYKH